MGLAPEAMEVKMVVKHTFLEFVEDAEDKKESRTRAFTDTALLGNASDSSGGRPGQECDGQGEPASAVQPHVPSWPSTPLEDASCPPGRASSSSSSRPPREASPAPAGEAEGAAAGEAGRTTVMLRNLPKAHSRAALLALLDSLGLRGQYDFVYVPMDFASGSSLGYAFVNLVSPAAADHAWACLDGLSRWTGSGSGQGASQGPCVLCWSRPHQGLAAHVERYMNSPVMHPAVPDAWKPAIFLGGVRVGFPAPTRALKAPKLRAAAQGAQRPRGTA